MRRQLRLPTVSKLGVFMNKQMFDFVEDQMSKGLSREDAIRLLAFGMDHDDPEDAELWFQQICCGG